MRVTRTCAWGAALAALLVLPATAEETMPRTSAPSVVAAPSSADSVACVTPLIGTDCFRWRWVQDGGHSAALVAPGTPFTHTELLIPPTGYSGCSVNDVVVAASISENPTANINFQVQRENDNKIVWTGNGTCSATSVDASFSDRATLTANSCPATGGSLLLPNDSMATFTGASFNANWTFFFNNNDLSSTGTLQNYGLAWDVTCTTRPGGGGCTNGPNQVCLNNSRFKVTMVYQAPSQSPGSGHANALTSDTGWFWFFNSSNVESIIKVLNGCSTNNRYWVFVAGLTNVKVTITVTDTAHGTTSKVYVNNQGTAFAPIQDTSAFATCP